MPRPVFQESHILVAERARLSRAIAIARVLCIVGIVYVHAWTGLWGPALTALDRTPQGLMRWGLIELLARSSVPLLSLISGWLVGPSLARRGTRSFISGKARTVLLPMVLWNAIAIVVVSGAAWLGWLYAPQPTSWVWLFNELTGALHPNEINVQMPFLRDLFVCLALAPLLVRCPDRVLVAIAAGAIGWSLAPPLLPLLLRPTILAFFALGIVVRRRDLAARLGAMPLVRVIVPYAVMVAVKLALDIAGAAAGLDTPVVTGLTDIALRAATAWCFWALAWRLANRPLGERLMRLEPAMFLLFCVHLILIWCAGPAIGALTGSIGAPLYPVFFLVQPALALGAALVIGRLLVRLSPPLAKVLSGGRLVPPPSRGTAAG